LDEESASRTIGADRATDECDFERKLTLPILLINKKSSEKSPFTEELMQARAGRQKSRSKEKRDIQLSWMSLIFIEASYLEIGGSLA
jgi:hypothetical protein